MRCVLALLSLLLVRPAFGQQYFEGLFGGEDSGNGIASGGTVRTEEGYLTLSYKLRNGVSRPFIFCIDTEGLQTDSLSFAQADTVYRMSLNLLDIGDQSYVGLSSWRNLNQESPIWGDCHLFRFDAHGQVEWESNLGEPDRREIPQRVVSTADGGFAIAGQAIQGVSQDANGDAYLIRTDALGNALWEQTYGGTLYDAASDLVQTPDGGFLLLGWTRSFGAGQRDFYLVKTDSLGYQQWQRTYGGGGVKAGHLSFPLQMVTIYCRGGGTDDGVTSRGQHYEVTPTGNVVWHEKYASGEMPKGYFFKSIQLSDGSIVSCGLAENTATGGNAGWILKTTATGGLLWQRVFDKNQHTDLFYSVLLSDDGGFLLSGQAVNLETMSQDAWLLKVDSVGCPYPNCLVGVDELDSREVVVDVWPNPVEDILNVEMVGSPTRLELQVIDISGREILRFTQYDRRATLDTGHWNSGVYILKGSDEKGRTFSMRIVKR